MHEESAKLSFHSGVSSTRPSPRTRTLPATLSTIWLSQMVQGTKLRPNPRRSIWCLMGRALARPMRKRKSSRSVKSLSSLACHTMSSPGSMASSATRSTRSRETHWIGLSVSTGIKFPTGNEASFGGALLRPTPVNSTTTGSRSSGSHPRPRSEMTGARSLAKRTVQQVARKHIKRFR